MDAKEAKNRLKASGHKLAYCTHCMCPMVRCGHCGNNSCNGGAGDRCPDNCAEAYEISEAIEFPAYLRLLSAAQWWLYDAHRTLLKLWRKIHDPKD